MDFREELENLQGRMSSVLAQLQQVHAKISATAESADRLFAELRGEGASTTDSSTVR
jgi:chaperonin cofactor prefoldin